MRSPPQPGATQCPCQAKQHSATQHGRRGQGWVASRCRGSGSRRSSRGRSPPPALAPRRRPGVGDPAALQGQAAAADAGVEPVAQPLEGGDLLVEPAAPVRGTCACQSASSGCARRAARPSSARISSRVSPTLLRRPDEGEPAQHAALERPLAAGGAGGGDQALALVVAQRRRGEAAASGDLAHGEQVARVHRRCSHPLDLKLTSTLTHGHHDTPIEHTPSHSSPAAPPGSACALTGALARRRLAVVTDARDADVLAVRPQASPASPRRRRRRRPAPPRRARRRGRRLGRLDLLVHNASTLGPIPLPRSADVPARPSSREVLATNVVAPLALTSALLRSCAQPAAWWSASPPTPPSSTTGLGRVRRVQGRARPPDPQPGRREPDLRGYAVDPGDMRTAMHQRRLPGRGHLRPAAAGDRRPALLPLLDAAAAQPGATGAADLVAEVARMTHPRRAPGDRFPAPRTPRPRRRRRRPRRRPRRGAAAGRAARRHRAHAASATCRRTSRRATWWSSTTRPPSPASSTPSATGAARRRCTSPATARRRHLGGRAAHGARRAPRRCSTRDRGDVLGGGRARAHARGAVPAPGVLADRPRQPAVARHASTATSRALLAPARPADRLRLPRPALPARRLPDGLRPSARAARRCRQRGRPFTDASWSTTWSRAGSRSRRSPCTPGVSSQEAGEAPQPERFEVTATTARLVNADPAARRPGGRGRDHRHPRAGVRAAGRRRIVDARPAAGPSASSRPDRPAGRRRRPGHRLARPGGLAPAAGRGGRRAGP